MSLIEKYLTHIENSKIRTHLVIGSDALFVTFRRTETALDLKRTLAKRKKYKVTVVLVLTAHGVYRVESLSNNPKDHMLHYVDKIVSKLHYGSIDSKATLIGAMGKYRTPYGVPCLRLTETKLEWYL